MLEILACLKMGVNFLFGKNAKPGGGGGGSEGGLAKDQTFSGFFLQPSLIRPSNSFTKMEDFSSYLSSPKNLKYPKA